MNTRLNVTTMKIVLGYLLVGSYANLFLLWKEKQENPVATSSSVETAKSVS